MGGDRLPKQGMTCILEENRPKTTWMDGIRRMIEMRLSEKDRRDGVTWQREKFKWVQEYVKHGITCYK